MMQPKKDKTPITPDTVKEINDFAKTTLTESDLKAYNLHCFSDAGLGVHTCNPLAPMPDGSPPPADEESYCSLHHICAVHLGARYGVGLAEGEPYDFEKSKAACKKLSYDVLVKAIREKQQSEPVVEKAEPAGEQSADASESEKPAAPAVKVRPRRLQKSPEAVLTVAKAVEITDSNTKAAEVAEKPAKAAKSVKPSKKAPKAKPAKKAAKPSKPSKPAKKASAKTVKPSKKAPKAKPVKPAKKAAKGKPVAAKGKPAKKAPIKPIKAKPVKPAKKAAVEKAGGVQRRGRPRTREFDPAVHCPTKKPSYWRSIGAVKTWTPDHKLTVDEVKDRLRTVGFRADTGSRMGVLLDEVKSNGGASLETLQKVWEKHDFKLQPLTHILKIAVKAGAFSMKGEKYVLGGHA